MFKEINILDLKNHLEKFPKDSKILMECGHMGFNPYIFTEIENDIKLFEAYNPYDKLGNPVMPEMTIDRLLNEIEEYLKYDADDAEDCMVYMYFMEEDLNDFCTNIFDTEFKDNILYIKRGRD